MRSITSAANGGRPVLPAGACGAIRASSSGYHQVHLIKELTLARAFGDQLESGAGKAHLFHGSTVSDRTGMG